MANFLTSETACLDYSDYTSSQDLLDLVSDFCDILTGQTAGDYGVNLVSRDEHGNDARKEAANLYFRLDNDSVGEYVEDYSTQNGRFTGLYLEPANYGLSFVVQSTCNRSYNICVEIAEVDDRTYYLTIGSAGLGYLDYQVITGQFNNSTFYYNAYVSTFDIRYPDGYTGPEVPDRPLLGKYSSFSNIRVFPNQLSFSLQNPDIYGVSLPSYYNVRYRLYNSSDELIYENYVGPEEPLGLNKVDLSEITHQKLRLETYVFITPPFAPANDIIIITPVQQMIDYNGETYAILGGELLDGCTDSFCESPKAPSPLSPYGPVVEALGGGPLTEIALLPLNVLLRVGGVFSNTYCAPINFSIPFGSETLSILAPCMTEVYKDIGFIVYVDIFGSVLSFIIIYNTYVWFAKWVDDTLSLRENSAGLWGGI